MIVHRSSTTRSTAWTASNGGTTCRPRLYAVIKKFGEDRAGRLASLVAYYGFFSLFPLLLVLVTAIGYVLGSDSALRRDIVDSALASSR